MISNAVPKYVLEREIQPALGWGFDVVPDLRFFLLVVGFSSWRSVITGTKKVPK